MLYVLFMKIDHKESFGDFGNQFSIDRDIDGFWGSESLLEEIVSPFDLKLIKDKKIMEVGVGSGRITNNLIKFNPQKIIGIEPSIAINIAKKNINSSKVELLNLKAQNMNFEHEFTFVFSLGVILHIREYRDALKKIYNSLKKDGKFIIWVYGKEGNELYLLIFNNLRKITILLPDFILRIISQLLAITTYLYGFLCKFFPLPLKDYFVNVFNKFSFKHKSYVIFDQLNPSFAKYFSKEELIKDLEKTGFKIEKLNHRLKYSYTAICYK